MSISVSEAIDELTRAGGDVKRVSFACDIGNVDEAEIEWKVTRDGRSKWVTLPRAATEIVREPPMKNFWLVTMAESFARMFGIEDFILTDDEAATHRRRMGILSRR